tara:strand:- start:160 stop:363 length:204 start_codon:yes stop_codon:yes gene_type:complete
LRTRRCLYISKANLFNLVLRRRSNYGKIVAKAWSDEEFKAKLMADPKSVLKENGVDVGERGVKNDEL